MTRHGTSLLTNNNARRFISSSSPSSLFLLNNNKVEASNRLISSRSKRRTTIMHSIFEANEPKSNIQSTTRTTKIEDLQSILGGDYAGQSATFSPMTGKLIPVPEHFVPDSMVEWGQIPSCLEVIVSEDFLTTDDDTTSNDDNNSIAVSNTCSIDRCTVQVMPEVGCGLDNLDTMKNKESMIHAGTVTVVNANEFQIHVGSVYIPEKYRIECIFTNIHVHQNDGEGKEENDENNNDFNFVKKTRTRVGVNLLPSMLKIKSPIDIVKEKKTSDLSSKGTIADGGGLDARTVTKLVGRDNVNKPFSEGEGIDLNGNVMVGSWKIHDFHDSNDEEGTTEIRGSEYWNPSEGPKIISLPGNVIVQYKEEESSLSLEISFVFNDGSSTKRIIVKRKFQQDETGKITESTPQYFLEEKL